MISENNEHKEIYEKVQRLSGLIRKSKVFEDYEAVKEKLAKDRDAQLIIEKLVSLGGELHNKAQQGEGMALERSAEMEMLQKSMDNNTIVKEYLLAQKQYLNLLNLVSRKIKDYM